MCYKNNLVCICIFCLISTIIKENVYTTLHFDYACVNRWPNLKENVLLIITWHFFLFFQYKIFSIVKEVSQNKTQKQPCAMVMYVYTCNKFEGKCVTNNLVCICILCLFSIIRKENAWTTLHFDYTCVNTWSNLKENVLLKLT